MSLLIRSAVLAAVVLVAGSANLVAGEAVPTRVMVRAIARDAKIIGSGVGGAKITIKDVRSGRTLAEGIQKGKTGDTDLIMKEPRKREDSVFDTEGAAGFIATVMISQPTVVEIIAEGPLGSPQSMQRATKTMLLVPGKDVLGDGVILEIHGFTIELLAPGEDTRFGVGDDLPVRVRVTMT